jgi:predicted  nucleic acid-binding Zn-ribbon protein
MQSALLDHPDAGFAKIWQVGCDIERELTTANAEIERLTNKVAQLYEGAEESKQRIKRLDETLEGVTDKIDNAWGIYMKFKEAKL